MIAKDKVAHQKVAQDMLRLGGLVEGNLHEKQKAIADVSKQLSTNLELDNLFSNIVRQARDIVEADRGTLFLYDSSDKKLWSRVGDGTDEIRILLTQGLVGQCFSNASVINCDDAYQSQYFSPETDRVTGYQTKAVLCIPILSPENKNEAIGVLQLLNKKSDDGVFTTLDEDLMTGLVEHVAGSIVNIDRDSHARNKLVALEQQMRVMQEGFEKERRAMKEAENNMKHKSSKLLEMSKSIAAKEELGQVFKEVMQDAHTLLDADRATLFLYDAKSNELYSTIAEGIPPIRISAKSGICGHVQTTGETLNINDRSRGDGADGDYVLLDETPCARRHDVDPDVLAKQQKEAAAKAAAGGGKKEHERAKAARRQRIACRRLLDVRQSERRAARAISGARDAERAGAVARSRGL